MVATGHGNASLAPADMHKLEVLLQARSPALALTDVHIAVDESSQQWVVYKTAEPEVLIYSMPWNDGNWQEGT